MYATQSSKVNVVIGVLLCGLLVGVRVVSNLLFVMPVVLIHFILIAFTVAIVFIVEFP